MMPLLLTAKNLSGFCVPMIFCTSWRILNIGSTTFCLNSGFAFGVMWRCSSFVIASLFSAFLLQDLTSKDDCEQSASKSVQELCQTHDSVAPSYVHAVQKLLKDALSALSSVDKDETSLANLRKEHELDKLEWEESLKSVQDKLNESENRVNLLVDD